MAFTRSAVNIMIDGVMTQDQTNKDSEFFTASAAARFKSRR
jgi:hypothetical protein